MGNNTTKNHIKSQTKSDLIAKRIQFMGSTH